MTTFATVERAITKWGAIEKREKSNIAIVILEKLPFLKGNKKLFRIFKVAIIFSSTAY